jgi:proteasome lid subunit RPN8/RPN11
MSITESRLALAHRRTMNLRVAIALFLGASLPTAALADAASLTAEPALAAGASLASEAPLAGEADLQAMAVKALRWAFYAPNGYRWEFSGILATKDGQLGYSHSPSTLKMVDAASMDVEKHRTAGDTLLGLYHTHPCKPDAYFSQYFSPADLISAFFWHVPTFILDECTGNVHEFDPVQDRAADSGIVVRMLMRDGKKRWIRLPAGRIVGNIGDQGPDLSLLERLMARAED